MPTMPDSVQERLLKILDEQFGPLPIEFSREVMFNDLDLDSLDLMELEMLFEEEFKISIPDKVWESFENSGQFIDYIKKAISAAK